MSTNPNNNISQPGAEGQDPSDYKPQLDEIAEKKWQGPEEQQPPQQSGGIVDKIAEYVPASVTEKIGLAKKQQQPEKEVEEPKEDLSAVPPHRPHHDEQIQEFLRDQHRSKEILGDDEDTKGI
ncbi:hypothetical protein SMACR_02627 [Sordaria macrospora]|uniref:WGS project CABT00000000 data, contig 2.11 n=2 Tax=Sordaria macrospora TaxID=5147 RepID=F7VX07_SORMK|nr:uncharacterized protein SMAC_02627 [Sordaria macrospora k-hell]KAA8636435.1 hypothetical protein SMACR_02627 [Sordaria macrospora]KAH7633008.1 hypothetical protein B0T09DRAFT_332656 [Sordaria sp. MPI-SDFR-AT-0083]WPJ60543.1 hypothetical protein SMAC4_02627 [Sordaria macrospora]CCC10048.1 unnamed protein product [Sordaria macrospora k-hell]